MANKINLQRIAEHYLTESNEDNKNIALNAIEKIKASLVKSAWNNGVKTYAIELLNKYIEDNSDASPYEEKTFLNGASNWKEYSEGGNTLIYGEDIAKRVCSPSELKRTDNGRKAPNSNTSWIDVQAKALYYAYILIKSVI